VIEQFDYMMFSSTHCSETILFLSYLKVKALSC